MFKNLLHGVIWSGLSSLANTLTILIIFVVLAIQLGPRAIGLVSMAMVFVAMANRLAGDEMADGILKKAELDDADCHTMFWLALGIGVAMSLLLLVAAPWIAQIFGEPELVDYVTALAIVPVVNSCSSVHKSLFRRAFEFKPLAIRSTLSNVLAGIVAVAAAFGGAGAWSMVFFHVFAAFFMTGMMLGTGRYFPSFVFDTGRANSLIRTAYVMGASRILSFAEEHMPRLLIGVLAGAHALGIFMLAWNFLVSLRRLVWASLGHVLAVAASKLSGLETDDGDQKIQQAFDKAIELPAVLALPAYLGFAAVAPLFFETYFGEQWAMSGDIAENLSIGFAASLTFLIPLELMRGTLKSRLLPIITGLALISVTVFILAFSYGGLSAIALGVSLHFCLIAGISLVAQSRTLGVAGFPIFLKWIRIAAAAVIMAVAVRLMLNTMLVDVPALLQLGTAVLVGVVLYVGLLWIFANSTTRALLKMSGTVRLALGKG